MITLDPERELFGFLLLGAWAGYVAYQLEYRRAPFWIYGYLVLKILGAWAFGWVYYYYYCYGDTLKVYSTASRLWYYLLHEPMGGLALLFRELSPSLEEKGWEVYYRDVGLHYYDYDYWAPVNYRFSRLLLPAYAAAGGGYYGMQGLMGLISGLLWYAAYEQWRKLIPIRGIWGVGFLVLPSALFWGSGVIRDSVGLPLTLYVGAWIAGTKGPINWGEIGRFIGMAGFLGMVRWEGLLLAGAVGIGYRLPWRQGWLWVVTAGITWLALWRGAGAICAYRQSWLSPTEHPELREGAHVFEITCQEGVIKSVWSWVQGAWYGLTGPYVWEARKGVVLLAALETMGMWLLMGWGLWRGRWQWRGKALFLVGAGVFVVGVVTMSMPFWGTVVRQRLYGWSLIWLGLAALQQGGVKK